MVGGAVPGLVFLGSRRKQPEQASKQHPLRPLHQLLPLHVPALLELLS